MRIRIRKGLDIPLSGAPEQAIYPGPQIHRLAVCGGDYTGLKPNVLVAPGDRVSLGQALFVDKRDPAVKYAAPGAGIIEAVERGPRRALEKVVVSLEEVGPAEASFDAFTNEELLRLDREEIQRQILDSGLWPSFRTRPFSRVPLAGSEPRSIFVTAIDTQPLAADPDVIIGLQSAAFDTGLLALSRLTSGRVWLCTDPGGYVPKAEIDAVQRVEFSGPHPAGLAGTHIHHLDPAGMGRTVWHIGYQDVIALGRLFAAGEISTDRIIALAGEPVTRPRLIKTRLGASLSDLTAGEVEQPEACRIISGSTLSGQHAPGGGAFLGRYHSQVSVIRQGGSRRLFGWLGVVSRDFTASSAFVRRTGHKRKFPFSTAQHGRHSGLLPLSLFEKIMPLDILPSVLFRALMVGDTVQAQALGCLELDPEDLALCSFLCPAKCDYGTALRINLRQIEKEG